MAKTDGLGIRILCPGGATFYTLTVVSVSQHYKDLTKHVSLVRMLISGLKQQSVIDCKNELLLFFQLHHGKDELHFDEYSLMRFL